MERDLNQAELRKLLAAVHIADSVRNAMDGLPLSEEEQDWLALEMADAFRDALLVLQARWTLPPVAEEEGVDLRELIYRGS